MEIEHLRRENEAMQARLRALEETLQQRGTMGPPDDGHQQRVSQFTEYFEESDHGANDLALGVLEAVIGNIQRFPHEQKFRRLKYDNPRLRAEVFSNASSRQFLMGIGFVEDDEATMLSLPPHTPGEVATLRAAAEAIPAVRTRDQQAMRNRFEVDRQRRSMGQQLRMEKLVAKMREGDAAVDQFVVDQLSKNDLGTSSELFKWLRLIAANIRNHPNEPKYRALKSSNPILSRLVVPSFGGLEWLLAVMGFEEVPSGVQLPDSRAGNAPAMIAAVARAENLVAAAEGAIAARLKAEQEAVRAEALTDLLKQREAEKRALVGSQPKGQTPVATSATAEADGAPRRRVPLHEALSSLLGKDRE